MADTRTMAQLLQAPTEGYEDAILIPEIVANNFELRHGFIETRWSGNFLDKMPRECLKIIESKSKVRQTRAKAVVAKTRRNQASASDSSYMHLSTAVELSCVTCAKQTSKLLISDLKMVANHIRLQFVTANTASTSGSGTLPGNTITNPREDLKGITTRSGVAYQGPPIPTSSVVKPIPEVDNRTTLLAPVIAPVVAPVPNTKHKFSLPYPSRRDNEKSRNQANVQIDKVYEIFKE
ncbi:hypothetical protein Tco_1028575 [Tanacetum coccineum]|uniref:Reverse transcriptase domain-containing protein n=1 Tax=Tanacetum coccineum TaxID=301880 RepID=A0ABQ5G2I8_9ASTR